MLCRWRPVLELTSCSSPRLTQQLAAVLPADLVAADQLDVARGLQHFRLHDRLHSTAGAVDAPIDGRRRQLQSLS